MEREVSDASADAVKDDEWKDVSDSIQKSEALPEATIRCDADAVADVLEM